MALDGISLNQLRTVIENTSKENADKAEAAAKFTNAMNSVDGIAQSTALTGDDKENTTLSGGSTENEDDEEGNENEEAIQEPTEPLDFSNVEKYEIRSQENTGNIIIYNKQTNNTVQNISPEELATLIGYLNNPSGAFINKRA